MPDGENFALSGSIFIDVGSSCRVPVCLWILQTEVADRDGISFYTSVVGFELIAFRSVLFLFESGSKNH